VGSSRYSGTAHGNERERERDINELEADGKIENMRF
jgi:hypothetical protein